MVTKNDKGKAVQGGKTVPSKAVAAKAPTVSGGAAPAKAEADTPKKPFNPFKFFAEVRVEARRITWPSRKETWITTVMVLIMVFLACVFFSIADWIFGMGLEQLVRLTLGS